MLAYCLLPAGPAAFPRRCLLFAAAVVVAVAVVVSHRGAATPGSPRTNPASVSIRRIPCSCSSLRERACFVVFLRTKKKGLSRRSTSVCRQGPPLACAWSAWVVYFARRGPKPPSSPTTSLVCQPHPLMDEQAKVRERSLASSEGMLAAWACALRLTHRLAGHAWLRET